VSITLTADDVRDAGDFDQSDYPDADIDFERAAAERLVNDRLSPPSTDNEAYVDTAAYFAAALVADGKDVSSVSLGDQSLSFDTEESLSLLETAYALDPTNSLRGIVDPDTPEHFVFNA
jgi:hypothetical protein